ncbi:MAG: hypothetical protein HN590_11525 [Calditrichaeota bacterium]|nr:hypothetical protein [Calditrichota bacterium]
MDESTETEHVEQRVTPARIVARLIGIVFEPRKTLSKVSFESGVWVPILIISLSLIIVRLVLAPEMNTRLQDPEFITSYSQQRGITEEKAVEELEIVYSLSPYITFVESPILVLIGTAIVSFIVLLIGKRVYKIAVPFRTLFNMVSWASVVSAIPLLLSVPLKLINSEWDLPTNPGFLLPVDSLNPYFHQLLQTLDVFLIWEIGLISIGMSVIYKISLQRALSSIGTMFLIFIVLNVLVSASGL